MELTGGYVWAWMYLIDIEFNIKDVLGLDNLGRLASLLLAEKQWNGCQGKQCSKLEQFHDFPPLNV